MEDSKKIFIRGSKEHGDKIIKYFEEISNCHFHKWFGESSDGIYFLIPDTNRLCFLREDDDISKIVMDYYKEVTIDEVLAYFAKKEDRWDYDDKHDIHGHWIDFMCRIIRANTSASQSNRNIFFNEKQAKSALAMAQISQYIANDPRYGGVVTDEEWSDESIIKFCIIRNKNTYLRITICAFYEFLAFHTSEQRDLFLKEHEDLVKDYLMIQN